MKLKTVFYVFFVVLSALISCCPFVKEEYLGNNLYLSEYDNADRRILFAEAPCSQSGTEIVPMTVLEYGFNSKWIIAKTGDEIKKTKFQYWIIKNDYESQPTVEVVKSNIAGPLDSITFVREMRNRNIRLGLKDVE
jgi:hypothetical protein